MPSKDKPIGIRFPAEDLGRIDAWAKEQGCTRHAAVLRLVREAVTRGDTPAVHAEKVQHAKEVLAVAEEHAARLGLPPPRPRSRWRA